MDRVVQTFDNENNRWILNIENTNEAINETIVILKEALRVNKLNEKKVMAAYASGCLPISDFINYGCRSSPKNIITASELKSAYCSFCGINKDQLSSIKFGKMMTEYIESEMNVYRIQRKPVRTGGAYVGITPRYGVSFAQDVPSDEEQVPTGATIPQNVTHEVVASPGPTGVFIPPHLRLAATQVTIPSPVVPSMTTPTIPQPLMLNVARQTVPVMSGLMAPRLSHPTSIISNREKEVMGGI